MEKLVINYHYSHFSGVPCLLCVDILLNTYTEKGSTLIKATQDAVPKITIKKFSIK